jgi:hypothetical protein
LTVPSFFSWKFWYADEDDVRVRVGGHAERLPGTHSGNTTSAVPLSTTASTRRTRPGPFRNVLLFGVAGLALARRADTARLYLIGGGAIYLLLFLYGLVIDHGGDANFVPVNAADNWLHLFLGIGMIALGLALAPRTRAAGRDALR